MSSLVHAGSIVVGGGRTPVYLRDVATITEVGAGEGEVNIIAWAGYIERGDTDPKYDWVTGFEEESGCDVKVKTAGTCRGATSPSRKWLPRICTATSQTSSSITPIVEETSGGFFSIALLSQP
mgnify:CR=1 FL=1